MDCFSEFIKVLGFYLVHPVSNAYVERGFSLMNLIKTDIRNRMLDDLLNACMVVKCNGVDPKNIHIDSEIFIDPEKCWSNNKKEKKILIFNILHPNLNFVILPYMYRTLNE